jgi:hypothetical protein
MKRSTELFKDKLTKKFFMQLPEGLYLASNLYESTYESTFAEEIASLGEREQQWIRIVKARVSQRLCRVFKNEEHHLLWLVIRMQHKFIKSLLSYLRPLPREELL